MTLDEQKQFSSSSLAKTKEVLDGLGIPFCLFLGTSLGAYRDHDFCEDDVDDADLGIPVEYHHRIDDIKREMGNAGFANYEFKHPQGISPEANFTIFKEDFRFKVDFFFYVHKDDKVYWTFYADPPQNRMVSDYFQYFDKCMFYGVEYNIPNHIEDYLRENYGENWKTPIPRRNWQWDKDNHCPIK